MSEDGLKTLEVISEDMDDYYPTRPSETVPTDPRLELTCPVCLNIYTDPVKLQCGHNFCRVCIDRMLDTQEESGDYFCSVCRKRFRSRPTLQRNITLRNKVENFLSAQPDRESGVFCTYCVNYPVPAVRSCLHCEVYLCDNHLRVHKKSPEHILCDPTLSKDVLNTLEIIPDDLYAAPLHLDTASTDPNPEMKCSICLNIYTDPVMLQCGHNICRVCIEHVLDTQEKSGDYVCPVCRKRFRSRPVLQRNIAVTTRAQPYKKEDEAFCTYCVDSPVPAVRSCLHCEVSLCDNHLRVHKKSPEHILCDPTLSMESRKCSVHKRILEYYCTEDETCICISCCMIGGHKGHQVEPLYKASEKKKETLRNVLQKLLPISKKMEERVQSLQEHRRKVEEEAAGETERVTVLFRDLRRRLEDLEKRVLREISGRAERISISIRDLEIKKEELSRKMRHIEELCNMTDPLTVLQKSDTGDLCDTEDGDNEDRERHEKLLHDGGGLDVAGVLHTGLSDIIRGVNVYFPIQGAADILLDVNTAYNDLQISGDRKTIYWSDRNQKRPETPERFIEYPRVLSSQSFSSGRHYWEVDVLESDFWIVGMCYTSIDRTTFPEGIGRNNKSWGLLRCGNQYSVRHGSIETPLPTNISSNRVRIDLDYEAGQISFYDLCDPIRHLHTFITTFTEPLHAGICVGGGCIKICRGESQDSRTHCRAIAWS